MAERAPILKLPSSADNSEFWHLLEEEAIINACENIFTMSAKLAQKFAKDQTTTIHQHFNNTCNNAIAAFKRRHPDATKSQVDKFTNKLFQKGYGNLIVFQALPMRPPQPMINGHQNNHQNLNQQQPIPLINDKQNNQNDIGEIKHKKLQNNHNLNRNQKEIEFVDPENLLSPNKNRTTVTAFVAAKKPLKSNRAQNKNKNSLKPNRIQNKTGSSLKSKNRKKQKSEDSDGDESTDDESSDDESNDDSNSSRSNGGESSDDESSSYGSSSSQSSNESNSVKIISKSNKRKRKLNQFDENGTCITNKVML